MQMTMLSPLTRFPATRFYLRIHRDIMRRASEKILCGKTITPVLPHEVYGDPRWHSGGLDLG